MSSAHLSILIPSHNRAALLRQTLESLSGIECPADVTVELVVVANACTDDTVQVVESVIATMPFSSRCVVEPTPGLSIARNRAVAEASGDLLAFLDDDVILDPQWLAGLVDVFQNRHADIVGGRVVLWWEAIARPEWMSPELDGLLSAKDHGQEIIPLSSGHHAVGANFAFRRKVFDDIGGFNAGLGRTGNSLLAGEEGDFIDRAIAAGYRMFYAPKASLGHWVPPHRATKSHLSAIAYGRGLSQVYQKPHFGPAQVARQLIGRSLLVVRGTTGDLISHLRGNPSRAMLHRATWMAGLGGLVAVAKRLCGRSPVPKTRASSESRKTQ